MHLHRQEEAAATALLDNRTTFENVRASGPMNDFDTASPEAERRIEQVEARNGVLRVSSVEPAIASGWSYGDKEPAPISKIEIQARSERGV